MLTSHKQPIHSSVSIFFMIFDKYLFDTKWLQWIQGSKTTLSSKHLSKILYLLFIDISDSYVIQNSLYTNGEISSMISLFLQTCFSLLCCHEPLQKFNDEWVDIFLWQKLTNYKWNWVRNPNWAGVYSMRIW